MSTTTFTYPDVIRIRRAVAIGLIAILILTSLALIAVAILGRLSSTTQDAFQADRIPVVQNPISPMSVPIPPTADIRLIPFETPVLASVVASEPSILSIDVPTPPL
jgi:hypothetical protein